jgi:RNA polymerase sigma-70 factor, ECF subfamily
MSSPDTEVFQPTPEVGLLLTASQAGDPAAREALIQSMYTQLRALAGAYFRHERPGHTLQPTALVNEAWLRLAVSQNLQHTSREHFFAAAANALRRVLIDHARSRNAEKRGGGGGSSENGCGPCRVELRDPEATEPSFEIDLLALDEVLQQFERDYPRQHKVVELKYFAAFTVPQIATILGISERTVAKDWDFAKAWLRAHMQGTSAS